MGHNRGQQEVHTYLEATTNHMVASRVLLLETPELIVPHRLVLPPTISVFISHVLLLMREQISILLTGKRLKNFRSLAKPTSFTILQSPVRLWAQDRVHCKFQVQSNSHLYSPHTGYLEYNTLITWPNRIPSWSSVISVTNSTVISFCRGSLCCF